MAEFVQLQLEESLSELEALKHATLFDDDELKCVVNRRREHEYKLRRRVKAPNDFTSYAHYEGALLSLIALRREQRACHTANRDSIEGSITRRTYRIYCEAIKRFPDNRDLWKKYLTFAKERVEQAFNKSGGPMKSWGEGAIVRVSQIYVEWLARLGQISGSGGLWVEAAEWEWEKGGGGGGIDAIERVRSLLKRGIRYHGSDLLSHSDRDSNGARALWHMSFRIELEYMDRIMRRADILIKSQQPEISIHTDINNASKDISLITSDLEVNGETDTTISHSTDPILQGKVAMVVFRHALNSFTSQCSKYENRESQKQYYDLASFTLDFIKIANDFSFKLERHRNTLLQSMVHHLKEKYPANEVSWIVQAWIVNHCKQYQAICDNLDDDMTSNVVIDSGLKIIYNALKNIPTERMIYHTIEYLEENIKISLTDIIIEQVKKVLVTCNDILHSHELVTTILWKKYIHFLKKCLENLSDFDPIFLTQMYEKALVKANNTHPSEPFFWELTLREATANNDYSLITDILPRFQKCLRDCDTSTTWTILLDWSINMSSGSYGDDFPPHLTVDSLAKHILATSSFPFLIERTKVVYLEHVWNTRGSEAGIEAYHTLKQRPVSLEFYQTVIRLSSRCLNSIPNSPSFVICKTGVEREHSFAKRSRLEGGADKPVIDPEALTNLEMIYRDALQYYGHEEPQLWIDFMKLKNLGSIANGAATTLIKSKSELYHKAIKTLNEDKIDEFVKLYTLMTVGFQV